MGQISATLRKADGGFSHWCPGCEEMHFIAVGRASGPNWSFDGNVERPTFNPSVRITGKETVKVDGKWTGEWKRDAAGNLVDSCCHYFLRGGQLEFCGDSTHALAGKTVPLPPLPAGFTDEAA